MNEETGEAEAGERMMARASRVFNAAQVEGFEVVAEDLPEEPTFERRVACKLRRRSWKGASTPPGRKIMRYSSSAHTRFYHRYHVMWATKYRYKVLHGAMRERIRPIIIQTCEELGVHIVKGVLARDHVHMFLSIPPKLSLSDVMQRIKCRSSRRIQMEFPDLRKRYWGRRFWARGDFSTTSGNVTDDVIRQYLELHSSK